MRDNLPASVSVGRRLPLGRGTRSAPGRSAFTLIEILCVVVILGVVSAVVIPQMGSRDDVTVAAAARVIMSDLSYAQNRAIATQTKHYVRFSGNSYSIYDAPALTAPIKHPVNKNNYTTSFGTSSVGGLKNVTITSAAFATHACVGFDELGSPFGFNLTSATEVNMTSAGTIVVTCGTIPLTIRVEPYTGDTSVQ